MECVNYIGRGWIGISIKNGIEWNVNNVVWEYYEKEWKGIIL